MKKNIIIIVVLVFALLLGVFIYKEFLVLSVNPTLYESKELNLKYLKEASSLTIQRDLNYSDKFVYNSFTLKNDFSDFIQDDHVNYVFKKDDNTSISFYEDSSMLEKAKRAILELNYFSESQINQFFNQRNINNDLDLINYLANYEVKKVNIFTSISKINEERIVNTLLLVLSINDRKLTIINGDINGYILESINANYLEISIFGKTKNSYILLSNKEYFNMNKVKDILTHLDIKNTDREDMYKLGNYDIYSDEKDPVFINEGKKESIREFLSSSNCTIDCIHDYSEPIAAYNDGGTQAFEYKVDNQKYYIVKCNKLGSKYNNGKDILIGKDLNKLVSYC